MKIQEIISEAISGSHWIHGLHNGLNDIIEDGVNLDFKYKTVDGKPSVVIYDKENIVDGEIISFDEYMRPDQIHYAILYLYNCIKIVVLQKYAKVCSDVSGTHVATINIASKDKFPGASASAGYDYVTYYTNEQSMQDRDVSMLKDLLYSEEALTDVKSGDGYSQRITDMDRIRYAFENLDISEFKFVDYLLDTDQINSMVHELVHIKQHAPQPRVRTKQVYNKKTKQREPKIVGTEYRSKYEPDQEKFGNAVRDIPSSDENYRIYSSSLQEIPAHAHSSAANIIRYLDFAWSGRLDDYAYNNYEGLHKQLKALKSIITNLSKGTAALIDAYGNPFTEKRFEGYQKNFNHPRDKKRYPVYKRFVKHLSQELINYYKYWNDQLINHNKTKNNIQ